MVFGLMSRGASEIVIESIRNDPHSTQFASAALQEDKDQSPLGGLRHGSLNWSASWTWSFWLKVQAGGQKYENRLAEAQAQFVADRRRCGPPSGGCRQRIHADSNGAPCQASWR